MDCCDVLIVGGGPAGSSCAWGLRSSGLHVTLLDKARFPRNKVCGGWITPFVLQALQIDVQDYRNGRTFQPITGFRISSMEKREVDVPYKEPISYGIRRCEFDEYLLRRCGAQLCEGAAVTSVQRSDDGWIVNDKIRTRLLIGAGGHFCPIARFLGSTEADKPVVAQEAEFEMDARQAAACAIQEQIPELYFCHDLEGYGWCFRKGDFLNLGLGRLDQHALPQHVNQFVQFLRTTGKISFDLPQRMAGHAYLLFGRSQRRVVDDAVMLIGDSAGLAYVQSGEGIRPAVESGLMAAKVIASPDGRYGRNHLQAYADLLTQTYGDRHRRVSRRVPRKLRNAVGRMLLTSEWFCRKMVVESWFLRSN